MKDFLNFCVICSAFLTLVVVAAAIAFIVDAIKNKGKIDWNAFSLKGFSNKGCVILALFFILAVVGLVYRYQVNHLHDHRMGSVTEERSYKEYYDAILQYDGKTIPCIAYVRHEENFYIISDVLLPYERSAYVDNKYDPDRNNNSISLGDWGKDVKIKILKPATEDTFERLKSAIVSEYGYLSADINSDVCHHADCKYANSIKPENRVRFDSSDEAMMFGYHVCEECMEFID